MSKPGYPRLLSRPPSSFFLFGPRGVGKSTWTRDKLAGAHRIDLLDEALYHGLLADPAVFAAELYALPHESWVVVDEIQRLPSLLNEVHRFIEERGLRFALLGSSARKLKAAGTNLLAGRALRKQMFPLTPQELGADFDLETVLRFGSLPLAWQANDRRATLLAYVLREEIRAESIVRNLPGFARIDICISARVEMRSRRIPGRCDHLVRSLGWYSTRCRRAKRLDFELFQNKSEFACFPLRHHLIREKHAKAESVDASVQGAVDLIAGNHTADRDGHIAPPNPKRPFVPRGKPRVSHAAVPCDVMRHAWRPVPARLAGGFLIYGVINALVLMRHAEVVTPIVRAPRPAFVSVLLIAFLITGISYGTAHAQVG